MKSKVIFIHGGEVFRTKKEYLKWLNGLEIPLSKLTQVKWKSNLQKDLGRKFEVLAPDMPNKHNARYVEWKIVFEKILVQLTGNLIFVGHSLGGIFLAKYFAENYRIKNVLGLYLVAAPFDMSGKYDLVDFALPQDIDKILLVGQKCVLYHSTDDKVVPYSDARKYRKALGRNLEMWTFVDRGHFNQPHFPELVKHIKDRIG